MRRRKIGNTEAQRSRRSWCVTCSVFSVSLCFKNERLTAGLSEGLSESESLAAEIKANLEGLGYGG